MAEQNSADATKKEMQASEKVIYACLESMFSKEEATIALASWALHASKGSSLFFGINSYAREVCINLGQPEKQRDLVRALNRALIAGLSPSNNAGHLATAEPTPKPAIPVALESLTSITLAPNTSTNGVLASDFLTFQYLVLEIIKQLSLQNASAKDKLVLFLNEVVTNMPWSEIQQSQVLALINESLVQPTRTYKLDQLKNFIKYIKAWLADELGAKVANVIVIRAIGQVDIMEQTKGFGPTNLF